MQEVDTDHDDLISFAEFQDCMKAVLLHQSEIL
jgi:hypothetical protein